MKHAALKKRLRRHTTLFAVTRWGLYTGRMFYARLQSLIDGSRTFDKYCRAYQVRKLHIGCGDFLLPGWLNTDGFPRQTGVTYCDVTRRFPFPDRSFNYAFSEHVIEHVAFEKGLGMLVECCRVLKPGGVMRISTPDLDRILVLNRQDLSEIEKEYLLFSTSNIPNAIPGSACFAINAMMRNWGHTFLYDRRTLTTALQRAGFVHITACAPGESADPELRGVEVHGREFPRPEFNLLESMVVEARKPA